MAEDFFGNVKPGARVHYLDRHGKTASGTVVINKGTHLVLNTGGRHGTPKVVTPDNYVKHSEGGKVKGALLSNLAKSMKEESKLNEISPATKASYKEKAVATFTKRVDAVTNPNSEKGKRKVAIAAGTGLLKNRNAKAIAKSIEAARIGKGLMRASEETQIDELDTSTLKSYGRKALKDLPKQVKRARTSWDKHVATNMNPDPNKAWDVMVDAEHKQKVRKAGLKRLAAKLVDRGETSVNEEGEQLDAYKSALAYETKKKIKKKKHTKETKKAVKEAYNARETEHSGAKKGKGAYYGRKQDAKRDSDKKRRENDKKACSCNEADAKPGEHWVNKMDKFAAALHDDPVRQRRVKAIARLKAIQKVQKAGEEEKQKHGGWTGMKEERIDEIGPFNISKHPLGAKALKVVDKVLDKVQDRADARFQAKHPEWKGKAPRKIDYSTKFPGETGKKEYEQLESADSNFGQRLNEISKDKLAAYIRRASRSAAASGEEGGVAWARTALNTKDLDKAEKAERKHIDKARKRIKGIERATGKLHGGDLYTNVPATNEGRESEYRANMQLAGTARRKPGHYLVRNGSTLSGPHEPHDALRKYKDMSDSSGVKIVHIKEAKNDKAKEVAQKALLSAKNKKGKTANIEPEMETPSASTSQPMLQGPEGADNARV